MSDVNSSSILTAPGTSFVDGLKAGQQIVIDDVVYDVAAIDGSTLTVDTLRQHPWLADARVFQEMLTGELEITHTYSNGGGACKDCRRAERLRRRYIQQRENQEHE